MFASGKNATASANSEPGARRGEAERGAARRRAPSGQPARVERQRGATQPAGDAGERAGQHALARRPRVSGRGAAPSASSRPACVRRFGSERSSCGEPLGRGPALRVDERARSRRPRARAAAGPGRTVSSGGAPAWIRREVSTVSPPQNGCSPASASQSITPTRPDVGRGRRGAAVQPLGRDVGERARDVAERGQRVELRHLRETEVEQPHVDRCPDSASRTFDGLTSRWTMPLRVRVCERLGDLRRRPRSPPGRRSRPRASPRAACGRGCTRRRCRRATGRARARGSAGSAGGAGRRRRVPRARPGGRAFPSRATIFSATSRPLRSSRASQTWPMPPEPSGRSGPVPAEEEVAGESRGGHPPELLRA